MAKKKKELSEDYIKGFTEGIKTNQAELVDIIERKSGKMEERVNKIAILEELKKEVCS